MTEALAPVVLFAYRRPQHTRRVLNALLSNPEAKYTDLIVFLDGPKVHSELGLVKEVYEVISSIHGFASIEVHSSSTNLGLARSVIQGVSIVLEQYDKVIVLEDDILVSGHFLSYMNSALTIYEHELSVASVHGYVYPVRSKLPPTFFIRGADCWGWATWRRAWQLFNPNGVALLSQLENSNLIHDFDFGGTAKYADMLRSQIAGDNDSWAVRWYASTFLANMLTLYPGNSLVQNIGLDGTGTHLEKCKVTDLLINDISIVPEFIYPVESQSGRNAFMSYFREMRGSPARRIVRKIRHWTGF